MTTGIFAGIAARAAEEMREQGQKDITPYWRTVKAGGELSDKFPGGIEAQAEKLKAEGHLVVAKGKKMRVVDFEKKLVA